MSDPSSWSAEVSPVLEFLRRLGLSGHAAAAPENDSPTAVVRCLADAGVHGRFVRWPRGRGRHWASARMPALLRLSDGRWLLAVASTGRRVEAVGASGRTERYDARDLQSAGDLYLFESIREFTPGRPLWSAVVALVAENPGLLLSWGLLAVLSQGAAVALPQLTRLLVDRAFPSASIDVAQLIIAGMVFAALLQSWSGWNESRLQQILQARLDVDLEPGMLSALMRVPFRLLERKSIGELLQAISGVTIAREVVTGLGVQAILAGLSAAVLLAFMANSMPVPALFIGLAGAATLAFMGYAGHLQAMIEPLVVKAVVAERVSARELFSNISMLKGAGAEARGVRHWIELLTALQSATLRVTRTALISDTIVDWVGFAEMILVWLWGSTRVLAGCVTLGQLIGFALMSSAFHASIVALGGAWQRLATTKPQLAETEWAIAAVPIPRRRSHSRSDSAADVSLRQVWFRYGVDMPWIVSGLDLHVAPGSQYHLSGRSGVGKSTILKLIAGLYEPDRGVLRIGGLTPEEARGTISYLPQFVRLFNASILDNLRLFSGGAPTTRLFEAADLTGLSAVASELPMGYDSLLSQGGENFSGGQRQLIALTAVLASYRPILVLDEPVANMDAQMKARFRESPLTARRTLIYTSHDGELQRGSSAGRDLVE